MIRPEIHESKNQPEPYRKWLIFSLVAVGIFMSTLDGSIVNVALPTMMSELGVPLITVKWVVVIYLLSVATILLSLAVGTIPPAARGPSLTGPFGKAQRFASATEKTLVAGMAIGSTFGGGSACTILGKELE